MAATAANPSASEQLHETCIQALKEEHKVQLQLEAVHLKLKKLRRYGKSLYTKVGVSQTATEHAVLAYAKNICLEFCTKVHQTFPREIRDTIYGYITGSEDVTIHESLPSSLPEDLCLSYFDSDCETQVQHQSHDLNSDHWWLPDFVGANMVRELGEHYYRTSRFNFGYSFNAISKFRVTDQWKLGFLPVAFVSNVEVGIRCHGRSSKKCKMIEKSWMINSSDVSDAPRPKMGCELATISQPELLVQMESLFGFRTGTALTINIHMNDCKDLGGFEGLESMCENIVPILFPTLQRLGDAGIKVRFTLSASGWGGSGSDFSQKFTSPWGSVSTENITKTLSEYIEAEEKAILNAELDAEANEDLDVETTTWGSPLEWDAFGAT